MNQVLSIFCEDIQSITLKKLLALFCGLLVIIAFGCAQGKKNNEPVISSLTASAVKLIPGQTATLTVAAEDEDNDTLEYKWQAEGGFLSNDKGTTAYWTAPSHLGSYYIEVKVDDGEDSTKGSIILRVSENPTITDITFTSNTITPGGSIDFTVTVSPDPATNDDITITWSAPDGGTFNATNQASVTWTAPSTTGARDITVTVSDGVNSDTLTMEVQVN